MKLIICRALGTILLMLSIFSARAEGLMVIDPWVRSAPPNAPSLAAFMMLENHSNSDISLVGVRSSLAVDRVELHRTTMTDGMMKMTPQELVPVPAHSSTELKPGSWHIMLIGPKKVPTEGEVVHLTLILSDGSRQKVKASVRPGGMMMDGQNQEMKHD